MADVFETANATVIDLSMKSHKTQIIPSASSLVFAGNDTDKHKMLLHGRGKSKLTVAVKNATDKDLPVTIYGAWSEDDDIDTGGVVPIGSFTVTAGDSDYDVTTDAFPYYIVSMEFAATPDGSNVTMKAYLSN